MNRISLSALIAAAVLGCNTSTPPTAPGVSAIDVGPPIVPYEAIDLGAGVSGEATALNDNGQIVGWEFNGQSTRAFLWQDGVTRDLAGGVPTDINDFGQVVGRMWTPEGYLHPFLWSDGMLTDLSPGAVEWYESVSPRLNNAGQVIWSGHPLSDVSGNGPTHAFLWSNGVVTDLTGGPSVAADINERGQVVGSRVEAPYQYARPFVWENGALRELPSPGDSAQANAINEQGQVVGSFLAGSPNIRHAVLWEGDTFTDLGVLSGDRLSSATIITESGLVAGLSYTSVAAYAGPGEGHPFRWQQGVLLPMSPTYQMDPLFWFLAVNELGTAVGIRGDRAAVVIEDGVSWVLPRLEGSTTNHAYAINRRGDAVGASGSRAVLWRRLPSTVSALSSH